jgi:hypothetical protein
MGSSLRRVLDCLVSSVYEFIKKREFQPAHRLRNNESKRESESFSQDRKNKK